MGLPPKWYQFLVGVFASLGSFLFGYDLGVIAEVIAAKTFQDKFNAKPAEQGLVVSMFTTGAFFGAAAAGLMGDRLGRRKTIIVGSVGFLLGGALQTGAENLHYLYSGRFFAGLGVGVLCMIVPLYQAELAHPDIRGRVTALQQFMLGIGALCASWISYGTYVKLEDSSASWRVPLALQNVPAIFLGALILLFPESPRWLIAQGRSDEGLQTLARLHSKGDTNDAFVLAEFQQIKDSIAHDAENEAKSYVELFTDPSSFRRLFICVALQGSVQMTGVSCIQYFSVTIFKQMGIEGDETLKYQGINSVIALIAQFCTILFIDRTGRRWPLIGGNLMNCLCFIIATILLAVYPPGTSHNTSAQWAFIVAGTWLYNFSFSCTCGPLSWIIPAEVFNTKTRAKGVALATMSSFAMNTLIGQVSPIALASIGWKYYYVFIIGNFTNAVFFWLLLPETARLPLEEMNALFKESPWIVVGKSKVRYGGRDLENLEQAIEAKQEAQVSQVEVSSVEKY